MDIIKSSRHSKIIGDFGENLICNWLSRSGFEVAIVDHTGIDIIAYNPNDDHRIGITVKSRTRTSGKENDSINIFSYSNKNDRQKVLDACKAFDCEPWIAIYIETEKYADMYLTSLENYDLKYKSKKERAIDDWKMTKPNLEKYNIDSDLKNIHIDFNIKKWF